MHFSDSGYIVQVNTTVVPTEISTPKVRPLSNRRLWAAVIVAAVADVLQFSLGPFGWAFFDEITDVITMAIVSKLIGFHWLFLPTFAVEFIPMSDMLPTWTGCVLWVVRLRKKQQAELLAGGLAKV